MNERTGCCSKFIRVACLCLLALACIVLLAAYPAKLLITRIMSNGVRPAFFFLNGCPQVCLTRHTKMFKVVIWM